MIKRSIKGRFLAGVIAVLMYLSLTAHAEKEAAISSSPFTQQGTDSGLPPIEQALVPEGVFAVQLAQALQLDQGEDATQAERRLSELGIEPANGWITEYPVTPEIIGDIDNAVATAAVNGKLKLGKDQALKALTEIKTKLGLNVSVESVSPLTPTSEPKIIKIYKYIDKKGGLHITNDYDSIPEEYRNDVTVVEQTLQIPSSSGITIGVDALAQEYTANPDPEIINNYYAISGPPAVTYYTPPAPYLYLYAWTPRPFWCSGIFFRGFFLLRDFHKHIRFGKKRFIVSNHSGRGDFRQWHGIGVMRNTLTHDRVRSSRNFYSPQTRQNARSILMHNDSRRSMPALSPGPRVTMTHPTKQPNFILTPRISIPHPAMPQQPFAFPIPDTNRTFRAFEEFRRGGVQEGGFTRQPARRGMNAGQR